MYCTPLNILNFINLDWFVYYNTLMKYYGNLSLEYGVLIVSNHSKLLTRSWLSKIPESFKIDQSKLCTQPVHQQLCILRAWVCWQLWDVSYYYQASLPLPPAKLLYIVSVSRRTHNYLTISALKSQLPCVHSDKVRSVWYSCCLDCLESKLLYVRYAANRINPLTWTVNS